VPSRPRPRLPYPVACCKLLLTPTRSSPNENTSPRCFFPRGAARPLRRADLAAADPDGARPLADPSPSAPRRDRPHRGSEGGRHSSRTPGSRLVYDHDRRAWPGPRSECGPRSDEWWPRPPREPAVGRVFDLTVVAVGGKVRPEVGDRRLLLGSGAGLVNRRPARSKAPGVVAAVVSSATTQPAGPRVRRLHPYGRNRSRRVFCRRPSPYLLVEPRGVADYPPGPYRPSRVRRGAFRGDRFRGAESVGGGSESPRPAGGRVVDPRCPPAWPPSTPHDWAKPAAALRARAAVLRHRRRLASET